MCQTGEMLPYQHHIQKSSPRHSKMQKRKNKNISVKIHQTFNRQTVTSL